MMMTKDKGILQRFMKVILTGFEYYFIFLFIWLELVFHFARFGFAGEFLIPKILFSMAFGIGFGVLVSLFPRKAQRTIAGICTGGISFYYIIQIMYSGVFKTYVSLTGSGNMTGQIFDYMDIIWAEFCREAWLIFLYLLPLILYITVTRKILRVKKKKASRVLKNCCVCLVVYVLSILSLNFDDSRVFSAKEVHRKYNSVDVAVEKLGVFESFKLDLISGARNLFHLEEDADAFVKEEIEDEGPIVDEVETEGTTETEVEKPIDRSPNILNLDFNKLKEEAPNKNVASLHEYISSVAPTKKNEYTAMFKDYNVIFVVAEGFSGYCVNEELMPTLYKMFHEGFYFENYYTPLWYGSTLGGEYVNLTGLMPKNGGYLSMEKCGADKNDMMFTLSKQLLERGYTANGYHNNSYTYYKRNISHPNLGLNWVGMKNGLEYEKNSSGNNVWPQSDLKLIQDTFDRYKENQPFYTYYLTVSGHAPYSFVGNSMSVRHRDKVKDLPYSDTTKAYIASQYELELAMTELIAQLEAANLADNTLIVLTADHVPYNDKDVLDEIAGRELDDSFEWYRNSLAIWSASMEEPVHVEKVCDSLDILPTVSNLLGLDFDSRMIVGQDIMSDEEGLVFFSNQNFITDHCSYKAKEGTIIHKDEKNPVSQEYIDRYISLIRNKFNMAQQICDYDYYSYIRKYK